MASWVDTASLPFSAGYAREPVKCKMCRNLIPQGALRLSTKIKSKLFDGYQETWMHGECFWKTNPVDVCVERIAKFDALKESDKISIRARLGVCTATSDDLPTTNGPSEITHYSHLCVVYAKDDGYMCSGCAEPISRGEIQLEAIADLGYFHMTCFFTGSTLKGSPKDFGGFDLLQEKDKLSLVGNLPSSNEEDGEDEQPGLRAETPDQAVVETVPADAYRVQCETARTLRAQISQCAKNHRIQLLEANFCHIPENSDEVIDHLVDCFLFGRPDPCTRCGAQVVFDASLDTYVCLGHISEWTTCGYRDKNPRRGVMGIPSSLAKRLPHAAAWSEQRLPCRLYLDRDVVNESHQRLAAGGVDLDSTYLAEELECGVLPRINTLQLVKKGTVVDTDFPHAEFCHVLSDEQGAPYSCTLSVTDVASNRNSFYKMQVLKRDTEDTYYVFRSWGRMGTLIGDRDTKHFASKLDAIKMFEKVFMEKTRNEWVDRRFFRKRQGGYALIETDNVADVETEESVPAVPSTLAPEIQTVIRMMFDVQNMQNALKGYNIDTEKMPLGKLSKKHILKAYAVLKELGELVERGWDTDAIVDATNKFYTLIPHNFGTHRPAPLNKLQEVKKKVEMLDSLMEVEFAYGVVQEAKGVLEGRDCVDVYYDKLNTDMQVVDPASAEYAHISDYVTSAQGWLPPTPLNRSVEYAMFRVKLVDVMRISRHGEAAQFASQTGNRRLLWHGSAVANFGGILSQGLRIAPPHIAAHGKLFGNGLYFADMISKSAKYCHIKQYGDDGLLLLSDVALGQQDERLYTFHHNEAIKPGFDSVKCKGLLGPDPAGDFQHPDGYVIPKGEMVVNHGCPMMHNEFIVYNTSQVEQRYLLRCKFDWSGVNRM